MLPFISNVSSVMVNNNFFMKKPPKRKIESKGQTGGIVEVEQVIGFG